MLLVFRDVELTDDTLLDLRTRLIGLSQDSMDVRFGSGRDRIIRIIAIGILLEIGILSEIELCRKSWKFVRILSEFISLSSSRALFSYFTEPLF